LHRCISPSHWPRLTLWPERCREWPAVACFDTAFHATLPAAAATYALPSAWRKRWDLRRYGFHGLSHAYASRRATAITGAARVITCHLGAGASLAAVGDGRSIDTTMGLHPARRARHGHPPGQH
jgi:acetate kinase